MRDYPLYVLQADPWPVAELRRYQQFEHVFKAVEADMMLRG